METRSVIVGISILGLILWAVWEFMEGNTVLALLLIISAGVIAWLEKRRAPADI